MMTAGRWRPQRSEKKSYTRRSASGGGAAESKRSPVTRTASTFSCWAILRISFSTAPCSSRRERLLRVLPTCQSDVWRNLIERPVSVSKTVEGIGSLCLGNLAHASCPGREGKLDQKRRRDFWLMNNDRSGFENSSARPTCHRQKAIFVTMCFCKIEATHNPKSAISHDATLYFAGCLLRSN